MIVIFLLIILAVIWISSMLMLAETPLGKKIFRFLMSFFMTDAEFKAKDWNKPIPTWQSVCIWILYLVAVILAIFY